jgi:GMP synthase (glutamine-hydrolysing)
VPIPSGSTHTSQGARILSRFAHEICGCGEDWKMADYACRSGGVDPRQVGSEEVILGLPAASIRRWPPR